MLTIPYREDAVLLVLVAHQYVIDVAVLLDEGPVLGFPDSLSRVTDCPISAQIVLQLAVPPHMRGMATRRVVNGVLGMRLPHREGTAIVVHHHPRMLGAGVPREIVDVRVAPALVAVAEKLEHGIVAPTRLRCLRPQRVEPGERGVALTDPVVVPVGGDDLPVLGARNRSPFAHAVELLLAGEIVPDVAVEDAAAGVGGMGIPHQHGDRDRCPGALTEDLAPLSS